MRYLIILVLSLSLFVSCQATKMSDEASKQDDHYNRHVDYTGYYSSKKRLKEFKQSNVSNIQDEYMTPRSRQIAKHLNEMDEINRSQVVETEDKVIAGVILNLHAPKQMGDRIEKEIRTYVNGDKDIIVYTDYTYWYKRIDEDASSGAMRLGEELEEIFDQFFEIAD